MKNIIEFISVIISFLLFLYIASLMIGASTGFIKGSVTGCSSGNVDHKFESRIDYIFPSHDITKRWATKFFWRSELCDIPGWLQEWLMDPVYLDEINEQWHKDGGWKQFEE